MAQSSRTRNSMLNLITGLVGQLLAIVMKFITRTVFIYMLGKEYLGINGLFSDILTMLSLTDLGLDIAINYKLYKPLAEHDDKRVRVLMKFYKQVYRVVGAVITVLGLCMIPLLPFLINDYETLDVLGINAVLIFMLYLMQSVTSYLFWAYRSAIMKANQRQYVLSIADYAVTICSNIVQVLVLVFLKSFTFYVASAILFNIIKNFINSVIAKKYYPMFFEKETDNISFQEIKGLIKDCGVLFIIRLNYVVTTATDNLVLSSFLGLAVVGLYSNYHLIFSTITGLLWKFYEAVNASLGNLFALNDVNKKYKFFKVMNFIAIVLYGTAGVGIAVCADEVIRAWIGPEFVIGRPFAILLGIQMIVTGLKINLNQIRNISGAFRQGWYRPIIGIVLNVAISIGLVGVWKVNGVVFGTIASSVLANVLIDPYVIHKYSLNRYKPTSEYYIKNITYLLILVFVCVIDMRLCTIITFRSSLLTILSHIFMTGMSVPVALILLYQKTEECQYLIGFLSNLLTKFLRKG